MLFSCRIWQLWLRLQPQPRPQPPQQMQTLCPPRAVPWEPSQVPVRGMACARGQGQGVLSHRARELVLGTGMNFTLFAKRRKVWICVFVFSKDKVRKGFVVFTIMKNLSVPYSCFYSLFPSQFKNFLWNLKIHNYSSAGCDTSSTLHAWF